MGNLPKLSIITTSLNREKLLKKTMESVLAQSYPNIEQLVIDGGSKDGTVEFLQQIEKDFQLKSFQFHWISEKDSGQGEAMNKGLHMAKGDFLMILNSDDFLCGDSVAVFMKTVIAHPDVDVLYGNHESLYEDGRKNLISHHQYFLKDVLYRGYQVPQSGAIFRRSLIGKVGGFNEALHHIAEHELFLRMMKSGAKFLYIPKTLQVTLEHSGRKTTAFSSRAWRETKKVNFKYGSSYFSPFYVLYVKNVYFKWLWAFVEKLSPRAYNNIKNFFYRRYR